MVDGEPPLHMMQEYFTPEFEMEPLFDKLGEHFMINLGPAGGLNFAIRDTEEVSPCPLHGVRALSHAEYYVGAETLQAGSAQAAAPGLGVFFKHGWVCCRCNKC